MDLNTHSSTSQESEILIERTEEMREFASLLPLSGFTLHKSRVYNIWGEHKVGKSTFVTGLCESETAHFSKILWITPRSEESIDTPQEFFAACANVEGSQENLHKESHELAQQIQSGQNAQDELQRRMDHTKEALLHPYV
jgi:hypothetical protein|tara:strand:+ start:1152 stop:1571 length:420 start_codon:yes stop_codon:yes gene_type:complete